MLFECEAGAKGREAFGNTPRRWDCFCLRRALNGFLNLADSSAVFEKIHANIAQNFGLDGCVLLVQHFRSVANPANGPQGPIEPRDNKT
jgi:hypothetical protein